MQKLRHTNKAEVQEKAEAADPEEDSAEVRAAVSEADEADLTEAEDAVLVQDEILTELTEVLQVDLIFQPLDSLTIVPKKASKDDVSRRDNLFVILLSYGFCCPRNKCFN